MKLFHRLTKWGLMDAFHDYTEQHCEYTDPQLANKTNAVLHTLADVTQIIGMLPGEADLMHAYVQARDFNIQVGTRCSELLCLSSLV